MASTASLFPITSPSGKTGVIKSKMKENLNEGFLKKEISLITSQKNTLFEYYHTRP